MNAVPDGLLDRRPSRVLSKICKLSRSDIAVMERAMFLNLMSVEVHTALASSKTVANDDLSTEADAIQEELCLAKRSRATPMTVSSVVNPPDPQTGD